MALWQCHAGKLFASAKQIILNFQVRKRPDASIEAAMVEVASADLCIGLVAHTAD